MAYLGFIPEDCIVPKLESLDKEGVIRELVEVVQAAGYIEGGQVDDLVDAILERESHGSTGLGNGVAIPHVKNSPEVDDPVGAFGRSPQGVDFGAVDGEPVHLLFLMISPEREDSSEHLALLRRVAGLGRSELFRRFLMDAETVEKIVATLEETEQLEP